MRNEDFNQNEAHSCIITEIGCFILSILTKFCRLSALFCWFWRNFGDSLAYPSDSLAYPGDSLPCLGDSLAYPGDSLPCLGDSLACPGDSLPCPGGFNAISVVSGQRRDGRDFLYFSAISGAWVERLRLPLFLSFQPFFR